MRTLMILTMVIVLGPLALKALFFMWIVFLAFLNALQPS